MPLRMRKLPNQNKWRVFDGKRVIAKSTTKTKAEAQMRLIRAVKHGGLKKRSK